MTETSVVVLDYISKNNPGISYRIEVLYRDTDKSVLVKLDGDTFWQEFVISEDAARAHAVTRDRPILLGPDRHLLEVAESAVDNFFSDWKETVNNRVLSQRYFKAANNPYLMIVSYVGDIPVDYTNIRLFYTLSEPSEDNPAGISIDSNVLYELRKLRTHHTTLYSMTDYIPGSIDIPDISPGQGAADAEETILVLPNTITKEFVIDAQSYKVRVTFTKTEVPGSTTVTYKTDYGYQDYTTNRSTKSVTFTTEEYGDAQTYLEAYASQEIELLKQWLAGNSLSPDLIAAGEGYVSYSNPQTDKNIAIKTTDPTKASTFYVPLVPYVDTSDYIRVLQVPHQLNSETCVYDGATKTPQWSSYQTSQIEISGDTASTEAGPHYVILTLKSGYCWEDGSLVPRSVVWNTKKKPITVPTVTNLSFVYNTEEQGPQISSYDTELITVTHDKETDVGTYNLTFAVIPTVAHNYEWNKTPTISWKITPKPLDRPVAPKLSLPYNKAEQELTLTGFDSDTMTVSGNKGTMTGPYTAVISLKDPDNYCWSTKIEDDDVSPHEISWTITIAAIPEVSWDTLSFTYDPGVEHSISIANISPDLQEALISQIGTDTAIEAGVYTAKYSLQDPEQSAWKVAGEDNTVEISWIINPATPKYTLSKNHLSFSDGVVQTVSIQRDGDGAISAMSNDLRVCKAQVRGTDILVTPTGIGSTTITIRIGDTKNYIAVYTEISVSSEYIPPLSTLDPTQISRILKARDISEIPWSEGEYFIVPLKGTVGSISLSANYRAVLIGISHNAEREGAARLHFAIAQDFGGTDIVFCDHSYLSAITGGQSSFAHNTNSRSNTGGWASSYLRDILDAFYEALPEELKNILDGTNKLTDNEAGGTALSSSVMPVRDKVWIPSEYELTGNISYSNPEEKNCQEHYTYFSDHLTRRQHDITGRIADYWTRSPAADDNESFVKISNNAAMPQTSFVSLGILPCFTISDGKPVTLLDSVPWSRISELMSEGRISEIAEVGDTKKVDANRRATLIGLDHNSVFEGANLAHFIIDKDKDDTPTAQTDYNYDVISAEEPYQQHQEKTTTNIGGWASSHLSDVLEDIYENLPTNLKNSIVPCRKYTDNGAHINTPENVTITRDHLFLLSEFEVFGQRTLANSTEQDYQKQYDYFKDHMPVYYSSLLRENKVSWWLRSPDIRSTKNYGAVNTSGNITTKDSLTSLGIIPGFTLGSASSSNILDTLTWGQISSLAVADNLRNYAQVGDTKQIHVDGDIGATQVAQSFLATLISLDHNHSVEGPNRAHFAIVRDLQDREIALYDNAQVSVGGSRTFSHNIQGNSNTGGWQLSNLRSICKDIYESLDDNLKTAIILQPKYTNNYGGSPDDLSQIIISKTEDYIWIPSAKELGANLPYQEGISQETYDYFLSHRTHISHATNDPVDCWTRTPTEETTNAFVYLSKDGAVNSTTIKAAKYSLGVIPCFCVGMKSAQISLEDMTWQEIQYYVQNNLLSRLVQPGATKTVRLTGNLGAQSYTGTYKSVLLDINHNPEVEGDLSAHFALCLSYNDDPIVFVDPSYETTTGTFHHKTEKSNVGGYASSKLRDIFSSFYDLFPTELKAVIRAIPKVTNNNPAGISKTAGVTLTTTKDKVWTLSQIERTDETRDKQQSYPYFYEVLRPKYFRKHNAQDIATYWLRNPAETQSDPYYYAAGRGAATLSRLADYSLGILPCFAVL